MRRTASRTFALALAACAAAPASAMVDRGPVSTSSLAGTTSADTTAAGSGDARGEHAASLSDRRDRSPSGVWANLSTPDAREPFVRPVVVEVSDPAPVGFDWTAAILGTGAGLALAVLAGVGVNGRRRRPFRPSVG